MQPAGWTKKRKSSVGFLKKKKRMVAVCRNLPSCPNLSCFLELLVNKHHMAFTYCCYQVNISFRKQIVEFVFEFLCVSHINSTHLNSKVEFLFYFFLFNQLQPKPVQPKKKTSQLLASTQTMWMQGFPYATLLCSACGDSPPPLPLQNAQISTAVIGWRCWLMAGFPSGPFDRRQALDRLLLNKQRFDRHLLPLCNQMVFAVNDIVKFGYTGDCINMCLLSK